METSPTVVMYGKPVADAIEARLVAEVPAFTARHGVVPRLAIVLVGDSAASKRYVAKKIESCERLHMRAEIVGFGTDTPAEALAERVRALSADAQVHGILVQLPLPPNIEDHDSEAINKFDIFDAIAREKDVDGVGSHAVAALYRAQGERMLFLPATALAVRRMMAFYGVETVGKQAVVVGRNDITSKPILHLLGGRLCNAAAIWCHRYVAPADQKRLIREADILVTAVGSPSYQVTGDMLKPGVAVFDVATRIDAAGKMHGDVDFAAAQGVASAITPVPRGVGPVTVAALCENLLRAAQFGVGAGTFGYTF